jgi:hypothetical protein
MIERGQFNVDIRIVRFQDDGHVQDIGQMKIVSAETDWRCSQQSGLYNLGNCWLGIDRGLDTGNTTDGSILASVTDKQYH